MTIRLFARAFAPAMALALGLGTAAFAQTTPGATSTASHTSTHATAKPAPAHVQTHHHMVLKGYKTVAAAKSACGISPVAWHVTGSKYFHTAASRYFGKTKHGTYVCEKSALAYGLRHAKN